MAFTADVRVVDGRLRTPARVNAGAVPGVIRVVGAGSGNECTLAATPGVVAWLDCRIKATDRSTPTIDVRLQDGTTVTRAITVP